MKICALLLLPIFTLFSVSSNGQENTPFFKDWHITISYFGNNLWNPGAQFGVEKVFKDKTKIKEQKAGPQTKYLQSFVNAQLGFYIDNPTHWAIFNNYQYNYRVVKERGKFFSFGAGPGVMRTFLPETYEVNDRGEIKQVKFPGRIYAAPAISIGMGRLWKRNSSKPWHLKVHNFWLLNYNNVALPQIHVEYGYIFGYKTKETLQE